MAQVVVEKPFEAFTMEGGLVRHQSSAVPLDMAVEAVKAFKPTKFDQSVELIFSLGIDAKQADQMIRGSLSLPHGIGKSKRVDRVLPGAPRRSRLNAGAIRPAGRSWWPRSRRTTSPTSTSPSPART
jgi:hypothetical protein